MSKARRAGAVVDGGEADQRPGEDRHVERSGAGEPGGAHHRAQLVGAERLVEDGVLALGGAHAQRVPGVDDLDARRVAGQEAVDDLRVVRVRAVHGVEPAVGPHRGQAAEDLVPADLPAAVDTLGRGRRQQQRHVVAGLAVDGREHLALGGLLEDEPARLVAHLQQVGGEPGPVDVHVHGQRGGRRDVGQPAGAAGCSRAARARRRRTRPAAHTTGSPTRAARRSPRRRSGSRGRTPVPARRSGPASPRSTTRRLTSSSVRSGRWCSCGCPFVGRPAAARTVEACSTSLGPQHANPTRR